MSPPLRHFGGATGEGKRGAQDRHRRPSATGDLVVLTLFSIILSFCHTKYQSYDNGKTTFLRLCQVKKAAEEKAKARAEDQKARGVDATLTQSRVRLTDKARQLMGYDTATPATASSSSSSSSSSTFQYIDFGAEGVWEAVKEKCTEKVRGRGRGAAVDYRLRVFLTKYH